MSAPSAKPPNNPPRIERILIMAVQFEKPIALGADHGGYLRAIGFDTCIISNNKEPRVKPLADACGSRYVSKAAKPSPVNYIKAMDIMGTDRNNTFFVGDRLFTDVWGANRAGIMSVLVKPIDKHEEIQIILKRRLEWIVLFFYKRRKH